MSSREAMRWGLGLVVTTLAAAAQVWLAYFTSPLVAFAVPVAAGLVAAIFLRPMLGVYAAILAIPLELFELRLGSAGLSAMEGILLVTAAAAFWHWVTGGKEHHPSLDPAHAALLGMIALAACGVAFAREPGDVLQVVVLWTGFLAVSILVGSTGEQQVERTMVCLVLAGTVVAVVALATTSDQTALSGGQLVTNRAEGTFSHPNQLAFFLVLTIPLALALSRRGSAQALVALAAAGVQIAALLSTFSRSGIIGLTVAFLVLLSWPRFHRIVAVLLAAVLIFSAFNLDAIARNKQLSILSQRLQTVTSAEGRRQNPRLRIYATALDMVADRPWLGVGVRNFGQVSPLYGLRDREGNGFVHAHDVFLTIATEIGLPALALFVAFLGMLARAAWRALTRRRETYPVALALTAALAGITFTGVTEYPLGINVIMATLLIEAGALIALARLSPPVDGDPVPRAALGR